MLRNLCGRLEGTQTRPSGMDGPECGKAFTLEKLRQTARTPTGTCNGVPTVIDRWSTVTRVARQTDRHDPGHAASITGGQYRHAVPNTSGLFSHASSTQHPWGPPGPQTSCALPWVPTPPPATRQRHGAAHAPTTHVPLQQPTCSNTPPGDQPKAWEPLMLGTREPPRVDVP